MERLVQTMKNSLRKMMDDYRKTPSVQTGSTHSMLMLNRDIRTKLNLLKPEPWIGTGNEYVSNKNFREFSINDPVKVIKTNRKGGNLDQSQGEMDNYIT